MICYLVPIIKFHKHAELSHDNVIVLRNDYQHLEFGRLVFVIVVFTICSAVVCVLIYDGAHTCCQQLIHEVQCT